MKMLIFILLIAFLSLTVIAYSTAVVLLDVDQIGGTGVVQVNKYNIRVTRTILGVSGNVFNNRITSISIDVSSSLEGYYNIYATVTSGSCSATVSWTNRYLSSTPTTLTATFQSPCTYTTAGASVEVRGVRA